VTGHLGRLEPYEQFFGLNEPPFSLAPDPRFLFASASHSAALDQVSYALDRREPVVVVTGEIGTGKTLLCRTVLQQLRRKTFLSVIGDPLLERDDVLKQLLEDFGVISRDRSRVAHASRHDLFHALEAFLASLKPIEAHAVVIIDEAQHLQPDVVEEIRLLSNVDDERGTLLQIILVGQANLEALLARPDLRQLQQRISRHLKIDPLNRDEVERYITHRLALACNGNALPAGAAADELAAANGGVHFTAEAMQAVTELSGGLPRVINLLCDRSLEHAFASRQRTIDGRSIQAAATELGVGAAAPRAGAAAAASTAATVAAFPPIASADIAPAEPTEPPVSANAAAPPLSKVPVVSDLSVLQPHGDADESFWRSKLDSDTDPARVLEEPVLVGEAAGPPSSSRFGMALLLAGAVAFGAVGIWLALRGARPQEAAQPPRAMPSASAPLVLSPRPDSPSPATPDAAATTGTPPQTATPPQPTTPPAATAPTPAATDPAAAGRFDIVVASFRTELRASSVANEVATLGLPIRRRLSDGWHQVISGPFNTRLDAEDAQRRLDRAGLGGTQIVRGAR
jgi:type II secretory pathway predicted ATPase ExeA